MFFCYTWEIISSVQEQCSSLWSEKEKKEKGNNITAWVIILYFAFEKYPAGIKILDHYNHFDMLYIMKQIVNYIIFFLIKHLQSKEDFINLYNELSHNNHPGWKLLDDIERKLKFSNHKVKGTQILMSTWWKLWAFFILNH